jgi:hypothetical protein
MLRCPAADLHFLHFIGNEGAPNGDIGIPLQNALQRGFFLFLNVFSESL